MKKYTDEEKKLREKKRIKSLIAKAEASLKTKAKNSDSSNNDSESKEDGEVLICLMAWELLNYTNGKFRFIW